MRVLVTGAGGQLGRDVVEAFARPGPGWPAHEVVACDHATLDVSRRDDVLAAVGSTSPHAIVHAAAWTDVDGCESDADRAFRVNALGTRHVAEAARRSGAHLCYVSTDYVFDGAAGRPYNEWDATNPLSVYGRSKLGGEAEIDPGWSTVRTSWVCGMHGRNFVKTMLRLARERDTVRVVADQHGCPTFTPDLAAMVRRLVVDRLPGTFHVTNQGVTTWHALARATFAAAGLDPGRVEAITTAEYPVPAPRPAWSVLDNAALRLQGIPLLSDWEVPLERMVKELVA